MKRAMFLICGGFCFALALGFGFFLVQYLAGGAGLQGTGLAWLAVTSGSVVIGLIQVVGFFLLAGLSCAAGCVLCAHGLVSKDGNAPKTAQPRTKG